MECGGSEALRMEWPREDTEPCITNVACGCACALNLDSTLNRDTYTGTHGRDRRTEIRQR